MFWLFGVNFFGSWRSGPVPSTEWPHNLIITFWVAHSAQNNAGLFSAEKTQANRYHGGMLGHTGVHFDFNLVMGQHNNIVSLYLKEPPQKRTHCRDRGGLVCGDSDVEESVCDSDCEPSSSHRPSSPSSMAAFGPTVHPVFLLTISFFCPFWPFFCYLDRFSDLFGRLWLWHAENFMTSLADHQASGAEAQIKEARYGKSTSRNNKQAGEARDCFIIGRLFSDGLLRAVLFACISLLALEGMQYSEFRAAATQ